MPWQQRAVHDIEAGYRDVSVMMRGVRRRTVRVPRLHELVVEAELQHVALLQRSGIRPCYRAARALVFRGVWRDDPAELQRHIDKLIAECRFQAWRR